MAVSGSVDFTVTRDNIIEAALKIAGALGEGASASTNAKNDTAVMLNMMVKAWQADGLHLWAQEELVVFPVKDQRTLTLAASGNDRACLRNDYIKTQLNGDHASGATTLTVDDTTGMANSDVVGVQTTAGGISWTTISSVDSSTQLTIASGISAAAADNKNVYTYTTVFAEKVLRINNAWRQTDDLVDIPVKILSRQEFVDLSTKTSSGPITQIFPDARRDSMVIFVWQVPDDDYTDEVLYLRATHILDDFDAASDNPDFPQEWYLALTWGLAELIGPQYGMTGQELREIQMIAAREKARVEQWDSEYQSIYLMPDDEFGSFDR